MKNKFAGSERSMMIFVKICDMIPILLSSEGETMLKVIIIGSPGAGKSTFARKLRDVTGLPLYYLDMLWHKPDRTTISRSEERRVGKECM